MRQVLGAGALGRPRGMGWRGRREGGSGWGTHVNPWLIHVNVWQKPLQYCKVISLHLIKINGGKKLLFCIWFLWSICSQCCIKLKKKITNENLLYSMKSESRSVVSNSCDPMDCSLPACQPVWGYTYTYSWFIFCVAETSITLLSNYTPIKIDAKESYYIWISSNEMDETGAHYTEWSKPER